jgi:hypothetical protein
MSARVRLGNQPRVDRRHVAAASTEISPPRWFIPSAPPYLKLQWILL